jgi:hypothetical protein
MRRSKSIEVTVETRRLIAIKGRRCSAAADCPLCGPAAGMVTLDEAALLAGVNYRVIWQWAESGKLHCRETQEGLLRICPRSLLDLKR